MCVQQGDTMQPPTVPVQKNVLLYLNPATIVARRLFPLQFWERRHLITLRSPPIVLCTAQCSPSVPCQCYHENTTINPLSLQCLSTLSLQVPLGLVSLRDRPSKNDPITVPPPPPTSHPIYTRWSDLFRAPGAVALVWLLTHRQPCSSHVKSWHSGTSSGLTATVLMGNTSITEGKTALAVGSTSIARGKTTVSMGNSSIFRGVTTTSMGDSTIQRQKTTVALGRASFSRGTTTTSFRKALMPRRRNT